MDYYVYIYWRLDINEPFYVGKGKGDRWKRINKRNDHFKKIYNKTQVVVEFVKTKLTEAQALYWEEKIIDKLVFEYGYSIDISNNRSKEFGSHLVNATWGGEGCSGVNPFSKMSEETKQKWIESHKKIQPMLGKSHTIETKNKISNAMKGAYNPFYGKHHTDEIKNKQMIDKGNRIIAVNIKNKNDKLFFYSIREAHNKGFNRSCISQCLNPNGNQTKHKGYNWYNLFIIEL